MQLKTRSALTDLAILSDMQPFAEEIDPVATRGALLELGIPDNMIGFLVERRKNEMLGQDQNGLEADTSERIWETMQGQLEQLAQGNNLTPQLRRVLHLRGG